MESLVIKRLYETCEIVTEMIIADSGLQDSNIRLSYKRLGKSVFTYICYPIAIASSDDYLLECFKEIYSKSPDIYDVESTKYDFKIFEEYINRYYGKSAGVWGSKRFENIHMNLKLEERKYNTVQKIRQEKEDKEAKEAKKAEKAKKAKKAEKIEKGKDDVEPRTEEMIRELALLDYIGGGTIPLTHGSPTVSCAEEESSPDEEPVINEVGELESEYDETSSVLNPPNRNRRGTINSVFNFDSGQVRSLRRRRGGIVLRSSGGGIVIPVDDGEAVAAPEGAEVVEVAEEVDSETPEPSASLPTYTDFHQESVCVDESVSDDEETDVTEDGSDVTEPE